MPQLPDSPPGKKTGEPQVSSCSWLFMWQIAEPNSGVNLPACHLPAAREMSEGDPALTSGAQLALKEWEGGGGGVHV